ncbi:hypothetical protein F4804DRAFT_307516 [Jackrogersella minutella]|nr:hypothetical protein F4804DRAFT_307516 [Jackrogersella minutella]
MASNHYGSLTPLQQYNQLSFSVIPQSQHQTQHQTQPQPQPQLQSQHQHHIPHQQAHPSQQPHHLHQSHQSHQSHQPAPTNTIPNTIPPSVYPHPPALPPTTNGVAQQQNVTVNGIANHSAVQSPTTHVAASTPAADEPQRKRRRVGRPPGRPPKSQATRDYLAQRASAGLPPPPPQPPQVHTPHPLNKGPYTTAEDAHFSLQLHVFSSGYGVSQKRTVKEKLPSGRYDPEGEVIRKDFACDRGGSDFVSQSTGERRRESKKCGCPWKAVARRLKREGDLWFLEVLDPNHNHPATPPDQMHTIASYRRWQRENNAGIRTAINRLTRAAAMPARQVADFLKGQFADPDLDKIDRHILRALSMSDVELPSEAAAQSSTVFEVISRRPTIILQESGNADAGGNAGAGGAGGLGAAGNAGVGLGQY